MATPLRAVAIPPDDSTFPLDPVVQDGDSYTGPLAIRDAKATVATVAVEDGRIDALPEGWASRTFARFPSGFRRSVGIVRVKSF